MTAASRAPFALVVLFVLTVAAPVFALDYDIDRTDDDATATACSALVDGDCTLRGAIIAANAHGGDDQINLPDGTYTLTITGTGEDASATGDLDVTDTLVIQGTSQTGTIIDGNHLDRVIQADPAGAGLITVSIRDLTIQHGQSPTISSKNAEGGGIRNGATSLSAASAAGIVHLVFVTVDSNSSEKFGGGISNGGTMTIGNCLISNNASGFLAGGGGIVQDDFGSLSISGSTIRDNTADAGGTAAGIGGGLSIGLFSTNGSPTVDIEASTFRDNIARTAGGIQRIRGNVTMRNCTISGNHATQTSRQHDPPDRQGDRLHDHG